MSTFSITFDASGPEAHLRALGAPSFVGGAVQGIADDLTALVALGFRSGTDPWGNPWKPLAPSTIRARRKGGAGAQILRDTGVLQNSLASARVSGDTIEIGTAVPYAAAHQDGATIEHAARSIRVRLRKVKTESGSTAYRFAKDTHKRAEAKWGEAKAWTTRLPARPFLPLRGGVVDLPQRWMDAITTRLHAAIDEALQ